MLHSIKKYLISFLRLEFAHHSYTQKIGVYLSSAI